METLKAFLEAKSNSIKHGKTIYGLLAKGCGIDAVAALEAMPSNLSWSWTDVDHFLAGLGNDDILAIIEARKYLHLPPLE